MQQCIANALQIVSQPMFWRLPLTDMKKGPEQSLRPKKLRLRAGARGIAAAAVCDENGGTRQNDDGPQPVLFTSIRLKHFDSVKTWLTLHRASDLIRS